jgi:hypothetical protein
MQRRELMALNERIAAMKNGRYAEHRAMKKSTNGGGRYRARSNKEEGIRKRRKGRCSYEDRADRVDE